MLIIEKEETPPKAKIINGMNQDICSQTQPLQLDFGSWNHPSQNVVILNKDDIALFSDSIPKYVNIKEINRQHKGSKIHVKGFPGPTSI